MALGILSLLAMLRRVIRLASTDARLVSRGPNEGPGLRVRAEAGILLCYVMLCYIVTIRRRGDAKG